MTSKQFNSWLLGYMDGRLGKPLSEEDKRIIKKKMDQIEDPENAPFELPTMPKDIPDFPVIGKKTGICSLCGIDLNKMTHYVCNNLDCPTGLGPTICSTE